MAEHEDLFGSLFRGRLDAYGTDDGGCFRPATCEDEDVYLVRVENHLSGVCPMGVYPVVDDGGGWVCRWGCVDFDGHRDGDVEGHAWNVHNVLAALGVTSWVERTRSGNGFHVWVFAKGWTPIKVMRDALLAACQIVGAPMKEINPKQYDLAEGQLGNYVRLPYAGDGRVAEGRNVILPAPALPPYNVGTFALLAWSGCADMADLEAVAALYRPPVKVRPPAPVRPSGGRTGGPERELGGLAFTIWRDGPLDSGDRSDTLFHLASIMREEGRLTFAEALSLLIDADTRWGKFMQRPNGEQYLERLLEKAW